jgi:hypothetical protein
VFCCQVMAPICPFIWSAPPSATGPKLEDADGVWLLTSEVGIVNARATAADVRWHRSPVQSEEGYDGTELTSFVYHHKRQIDIRPICVAKGCRPSAIGVDLVGA